MKERESLFVPVVRRDSYSRCAALVGSRRYSSLII